MLKKSDIETNPDFAYDWAMKGIEFEKNRILKALSSMTVNGHLSQPWFIVEKEIINEKDNG